jgi:hypothetical protein
MAAWIWSLILLGCVLAGCALLLFSAHIPWLREVTDAPPLKDEAVALLTSDLDAQTAAAARHAHTAADLPHGTTRRGTHL